MPPREPGNRPQATQPTISHFWANSTTNNDIPAKRARSPVDLTLDSDEEPPLKRLKPSENPIPNVTSNTARPESPMKKRFKYVASSSPEPPTSFSNSPEVSKKQEERRKLLRGLLRQVNEQKTPVQTESEDAIDLTQENNDDEASSDPLEGLYERFAATKAKESRSSEKTASKSKQNAGPRKKKINEIGPSGQTYTPLEIQVKQIKEDNPGTLLLFEVGYKYRFFGEDAQIASKALGIACFMDRNFLTGYIPVHRKTVHLKKLLSLGHRVGIVGQTETAALKKAGTNKSGPFTRAITELYTATTFVDEMDSIDNGEILGGSGATLLCISESLMGGMGADERVLFGVVSICLSTAEIIYDEFIDTGMRPELETRLTHLRPCELLLPKEKLSVHTEKVLKHYAANKAARIEDIDNVFDYTDAFEYLRKFYETPAGAQNQASSSTFEQKNYFAAIVDFPKQVSIALAHAIRHLVAFGLSDAFQRTSFFGKFLTRSHMLLNANSLINLEIFQNQTDYSERGSLIWILDRTMTRFGSRQLRQWVGKPLVDKVVLQERFDAVEEIIAGRSATLVKLRTLLKGLPDLVKGLCRIQYGKSNPKELATILTALSRVAHTFEPIKRPEDAGFSSPLLNDIVFAIPQIREPVDGFMRDIDLKRAREGELPNLWKDSEKYPEIEEAQLAIASVEGEMQEHLKEVRKILRRPGLNWVTVSDVDFLVEVPNSEKNKVPASWNRMQGTKKVTRFHTPEARQKTLEREQHRETLTSVALKAFNKFQEEINGHYSVLRDAINKLAIADALISLAQVATRKDYVKPMIIEDNKLVVTQGRHPMVEAISLAPFVPNNVELGGEGQLASVITGPNMGGKSSCVKMTALIVIMAQVGCYVPAERAEISLHDTVLTRMGAWDEIAYGRSTFMVEMSETADILRAASEKSLVILDELGRGTATYDGLAIAGSVLEYMVTKVKCKILFITHYPQIGLQLSQQYPDKIKNNHMGYVEGQREDGHQEIHFLYRLESGIANRSFGVECGRLAGLPENVLQVAAAKSKEADARERKRRSRYTLKQSLNIIKADKDVSHARHLLGDLVTKMRAISIQTE